MSSNSKNGNGSSEQSQFTDQNLALLIFSIIGLAIWKSQHAILYFYHENFVELWMSAVIFVILLFYIAVRRSVKKNKNLITRQQRFKHIGKPSDNSWEDYK